MKAIGLVIIALLAVIAISVTGIGPKPEPWVSTGYGRVDLDDYNVCIRASWADKNAFGPCIATHAK